MTRSIPCSISLLVALSIAACGSDDDAADGSGGSGGKGSSSASSSSSSSSPSSSSSSSSSSSGSTSGAGGTDDPNPSGGGGQGGTVDPVGTEGDGDFEIGPDYRDAPEIKRIDGVPQGRTFTFSLSSRESDIFTGHDPTLNDNAKGDFNRRVEVAIPATYVDGAEAPFMVVQDARDRNEIINTINNLVADPNNRFPSVIAIFAASGGGDSYGSERGLEYDTMSDAYQRFVDTELLEAVKNDQAVHAAYPNLKFTSNPDGRATYGCSSGGAAALTMGWFGHDTYRKIVTYSGTFVDQQNPLAPTEAEYPDGAWEYTEGLIRESPPKPLRVFLQVGENDLGSTRDEASHHNWVMANQRVAAILKEKGYHYRFVYANGASHCDGRVIRQTLPDTLRWMWRGYPVD
ncbi:alpha/beta hydrolase [Sorangium sp. So ce363]|uniref:alpha/beta hydrolase n=1 Tax=Sorangium sp. So ce363 TaxID=3133304 RepID=UPI003F5F0518